MQKINNLDKIAEELESDWERSVYTLSHTFAIAKVSDDKISMLVSSDGNDKVLFNRAGSDICALDMKELKEKSLYDIVARYMYDSEESLIEKDIPNNSVSEFFDICRSVTSQTEEIYELTDSEVYDLLNINKNKYYILMIKEEK